MPFPTHKRTVFHLKTCHFPVFVNIPYRFETVRALRRSISAENPDKTEVTICLFFL